MFPGPMSLQENIQSTGLIMEAGLANEIQGTDTFSRAEIHIPKICLAL